MEVELSEFPGLTVTKACVLLGITEAELNLETCAVKIHNVASLHRGVGGEEDFGCTILRIVNHEPNVPLHSDGVCHKRIACAILERSLHLLHPAQIGMPYVYFAVKYLRSSPACATWSFVQVSQRGIVAQSTDEMEST